MTAPGAELDFDLAAPDGVARRTSTIRLTASERVEMGRLARIKGDDRQDILEEITKYLETELDLGRASDDPLAILKALTAVKRTCLVLFEAGYGPEMQSQAVRIEEGIEGIVRLARLKLVRRLLSDKTTEDEASAIGAGIAALISAGAWEFDWDEFETEIARCAQSSR
jgi:hypothetical protein